jgi:CheY-like chemotaxis protein
MAERTLEHCRILVVEDEYMLADDLCSDLRDAGAAIIGPAGSVDDALRLVTSGAKIDGAILDINLRGKMVFPVADILIERRVPLILATGYDTQAIPGRYSGVVRCEKPVSINKIVEVLGRLIHAA